MNVTEQSAVKIPKPEFAQYERVLLDYNELCITQVVGRWYEFDKDSWWYKCSNQGDLFYPESALTHISDDFDLEEFRKNY